MVGGSGPSVQYMSWCASTWIRTRSATPSRRQTSRDSSWFSMRTRGGGGAVGATDGSAALWGRGMESPGTYAGFTLTPPAGLVKRRVADRHGADRGGPRAGTSRLPRRSEACRSRPGAARRVSPERTADGPTLSLDAGLRRPEPRAGAVLDHE